MLSRLLLCIVVCVLCLACGSSSPAAPSAPVIAQVAGVWRGTATTLSTAGGECFAATFAAFVNGTAPVTASITQSGGTVGVTVTDVTSGGSCVYTGSVGQSAIQLTWQSCTASNLLGARCPSGIGTRDILLQTSSVNATAVGTSLSGTEADTYNVVNSTTKAGVGTLNIQTSFTMTRQ
jgi:hypothetical protein